MKLTSAIEDSGLVVVFWGGWVLGVGGGLCCAVMVFLLPPVFTLWLRIPAVALINLMHADGS